MLLFEFSLGLEGRAWRGNRISVDRVREVRSIRLLFVYIYKGGRYIGKRSYV